eukprot:scpid95727/ scgid9051/ 
MGPQSIINMDQTIVRFDMPWTKTNNARGARTVRIKTTHAEKKGFTVALAATASGVKLPAFIILKERNGVFGSRVANNLSVPSNVTLHASLNGWMNADLLKVWLRRDTLSRRSKIDCSSSISTGRMPARKRLISSQQSAIPPEL